MPCPGLTPHASDRVEPGDPVLHPFRRRWRRAWARPMPVRGSLRRCWLLRLIIKTRRYTELTRSSTERPGGNSRLADWQPRKFQALRAKRTITFPFGTPCGLRELRVQLPAVQRALCNSGWHDSLSQPSHHPDGDGNCLRHQPPARDAAHSPCQWSPRHAYGNSSVATKQIRV
jgi:hypothetical protein